ncbi:LacI family DNA-binding transcriptional regulator [Rathayibacter sp. VKM Ac-2927]|uniref:LacI family DNA-binding transcriptional regulator n=1 Tax=Rathayibacter sp. VKM Ac-2927 TaxID=2929478 RepID=UPI001FB2577B|nr:LacI family DNA-binding transcriptional regulator [Rathayibacter sp. VKM Ac-2927]MCJ1687599.1 LacI family transcriptional regulator [Rathayibacter sp. VKM Ac-2927]
MDRSGEPPTPPRPPRDLPVRRATIRDVAREAGVSRQTVTRAMNGMSEISAATRERVLAVSEALGYVPSRFAANMARQKSIAVGLVITSLRNPYYTDLAADLLEEFAARGWQVVVVAETNESEEQIVADLATQVDVIVGYLARESLESIRRAARGVPVLLIERDDELPGVHAIAVDFAPGMRALVDGLRERGARTIGMLDHAEPDEYAPSARRLRFEECLAPGEAALVATGGDTIAGGADAFGELLAAHPEVDAVIAFNDMMALGALQRASRLGLEVPRDVRIAGIDGLSLGAAMLPSLTSLTIDRALIARAAALRLAELLSPAGAIPGGAGAAGSMTVVTPWPEWRDSA